MVGVAGRHTHPRRRLGGDLHGRRREETPTTQPNNGAAVCHRPCQSGELATQACGALRDGELRRRFDRGRTCGRDRPEPSRVARGGARSRRADQGARNFRCGWVSWIIGRRGILRSDSGRGRQAFRSLSGGRLGGHDFLGSFWDRFDKQRVFFGLSCDWPGWRGGFWGWYGWRGRFWGWYDWRRGFWGWRRGFWGWRRGFWGWRRGFWGWRRGFWGWRRGFWGWRRGFWGWRRGFWGRRRGFWGRRRGFWGWRRDWFGWGGGFWGLSCDRFGGAGSPGEDECPEQRKHGETRAEEAFDEDSRRGILGLSRASPSSARRAEGIVSGVKLELLARAVSGRSPVLGGMARGNPLSQGDSMLVIAERGQAAHAQSQQCERHEDGWDQDKEQDDL